MIRRARAKAGEERLSLSIGAGIPVPIEKDWRFEATSKANVGDDRARATIPATALIDAGFNLLGDFLVLSPDSHTVVWSGYVEHARITQRRGHVHIQARGWGHTLNRMQGTVKSPGLTSPEIVYNLALAAGLDPSGVQGYAPSLHPYRVSKGLKGIRTPTRESVWPAELGPVRDSDESGVIRASRLDVATSNRDAWSTGVLASTTLDASTFWEAMAEGGVELFHTIALIQYQWLSGMPGRFASEAAVPFRAYWLAPSVALSGTSLARQLDAAKSLAMRKPRFLRRPTPLPQAAIDSAVEIASQQASSLQSIVPERRARLMNAVHLFVRATEATGWDDALLFYSAAADEIAKLAPRSRVLTRSDKARVAAAVRRLFGKADARCKRIVELLDRANDPPFKARLRAVATSARAVLSEDSLEDVSRLYEMRNYLVHAGIYPDERIYSLFRRGLSILDRLIFALLPKAT